MKQQEKRICIKYKDSGAIFRVSKSLAELEVNSGKATYVSKSALYHFWNTEAKLESNAKILKANNFNKEQKDNFLVEDGKKTYAYLKRGNKVTYEPYAEPKKEDKPKLKWWEKLLNKVTFGLYEAVVNTLKPDEKDPRTWVNKITTPVYQRFLVAVK